MQRTLLISLVGVSYLLFAGAPSWSLLPLLALAAAGVLADDRHTLVFPATWRSVDLALAALVAGIIVQLIPLPRFALAIVSPHATEVRDALELTTMIQGTPAWSAISVNPRATLDALITVIIGVLAFLSARAMFSRKGGTRQFCRILAVIAGVAAVVAVAQRAIDPKMLFGVVRPPALSASPFGAFVNRNHFAGWLLMIAGPVFGYLLAHLHIHAADRQHWRHSVREFFATGALLTALSGIVTVGTILLTLSRSAVAGLGAAALCGWRLGRHRLRVERTSYPAALGAAGVMLIVLVTFVDLDGWSTRLQESLTTEGQALSRLNIWRETLPMARDFWLTGTGAGTYSDAMTSYQQTRVWVASMSKWAHFNNAHSHYLQVVSEGGVLLAVPAALAIAALARIGRRAVKQDAGEVFWIRVGAAASLAGIAIQSIWESSLILPANAVLCGTLAGLLIHQRLPRASEMATPREERPGGATTAA